MPELSWTVKVENAQEVVIQTQFKNSDLVSQDLSDPDIVYVNLVSMDTFIG